MRMFGTENCNAAERAEQGPEWPSKPFLLHQEVNAHATREHIEQAHDKIPIAGMGSQADNAFLRKRQLVFDGPFHALDKKPVTNLLNHNCFSDAYVQYLAEIADLVDDVRDLMIEVVDEVVVVLSCFQTWFGMRDAFDEIIAQDDDGRKKLLRICGVFF